MLNVQTSGSVEWDERLKQGEKKEDESKSRIQDRSMASKASTYVSVKKNNKRRRKRKGQTSQR